VESAGGIEFDDAGGAGVQKLNWDIQDREKLSKEWGEISAEVARDTVHVFDDHLASSPYIAGEAFSVADITLALTLTFARAVGQDLLQLPHLVSWHDKVSSRASFA